MQNFQLISPLIFIIAFLEFPSIPCAQLTYPGHWFVLLLHPLLMFFISSCWVFPNSGFFWNPDLS